MLGQTLTSWFLLCSRKPLSLRSSLIPGRQCCLLFPSWLLCFESRSLGGLRSQNCMAPPVWPGAGFPLRPQPLVWACAPRPSGHSILDGHPVTPKPSPSGCVRPGDRGCVCSHKQRFSFILPWHMSTFTTGHSVPTSVARFPVIAQVQPTNPTAWWLLLQVQDSSPYSSPSSSLAVLLCGLI